MKHIECGTMTAYPKEDASLSPTVWIVVPAYNEESTLRDVVQSLRRHGYQVVVVDDGSVREASPLLIGTGAHLCRHYFNLGQGAALQTGITYALIRGAEYVVTFDADGQHDVADVARLLRPLIDGRCDAALGSRFLRGGEAVNIPPLRKALLRLATQWIRLTSGLALTDAHNGIRAFTAAAANRIRITQNGMAHASQFTSEIARLGLRYEEVPVRVSYTAYSLQKGQRWSNAFNIMWDSFAERFR